jgi:hypothetical protein
MANALFLAAKNTFLGSGTRIDLDTDNTRIIFVDHTDDTPDPALDTWLSDITGAARVAESSNLAGASVASGAYDTNDPTLPSVSGDQFESVVLFKETGTEGSSDLIAFYDTATGLPFSPSGGDITVVVNAAGWFSL